MNTDNKNSKNIIEVNAKTFDKIVIRDKKTKKEIINKRG